MDGSIDPGVDYVAELEAANGASWPNIRKAREATEQQRAELYTLLYGELPASNQADADIVLFGSLARGDWSDSSDIDWTLLIDGQAVPEHARVRQRIAERINTNRNSPGREGIFGGLAFSHDIVHWIGGESDSNRNTTLRLLLLLESVTLRPNSDWGNGAYERVVKQILDRYLSDDTMFFAKGSSESRIPRFLLNDFVRYWRTLCVDFAYKQWDRAGQEWALKNAKLRMSRKSLFVSSLLLVFSCFRNRDLPLDTDSRDEYVLRMQEHLINFVRSTPLQIMAWTLGGLKLQSECRELLSYYDAFLAKMADSTVRNKLKAIGPADAYQNDVFLELRELSHNFQRVLTRVFFVYDTPLKEFCFEFGVF